MFRQAVLQILRCLYLYFCTGKTSKLSSKLHHLDDHKVGMEAEVSVPVEGHGQVVPEGDERAHRVNGETRHKREAELNAWAVHTHEPLVPQV